MLERKPCHGEVDLADQRARVGRQLRLRVSRHHEQPEVFIVVHQLRGGGGGISTKNPRGGGGCRVSKTAETGGFRVCKSGLTVRSRRRLGRWRGGDGWAF